jgi:hypothetical protein
MTGQRLPNAKRSRAGNRALGVALALASCVACSEREALTHAERAQAKQIVLPKAPSPKQRLDIRFEDKITLLGYDVSTPVVREGVSFSVTWYWQVRAPLGEGWKVFTHVADAQNRNRLNLDAVRPLRKLHPEETWKAGQYLQDVQEITLPVSWDSDRVVFYLGFWNGPHRLHVSQGPHDADNRARALELTVVDIAGGSELPRLGAKRLGSKLTLDGALDEPDWKAAEVSAPFVQTMTGAVGSFGARVRVAYDAEHLYLGYEVADDQLKCSFENPDDHLWEQDTIEVMIDPDGDLRNYFEIQVSPKGLVFDTRYDSRRKPQPFGDVGWSSGTQAKVAVKGTIDDGAPDEGYVVEMAVPWAAFAAGPTTAAPPLAGSSWRMNFFVMDARDKGQRAVGWSAPLVGDFHTLERFGEVTFPAAAVPAAEAAPAKAPTPPGPAPATAPRVSSPTE